MPTAARSRARSGIAATFGIHCGFAHATANTDEHVEAGEDEAGNDRRRVELGQRLLGHDGVDRDQHRGRNEHVERSRRGDGAGGERRLVAVAAHLRDRHPGERGGGRDRGAADRAEQRAGADRGVRQRAADAGEHRVGGLEQLGRHVGARGDRAHQDEQRDDRERIGARQLNRARGPSILSAGASRRAPRSRGSRPPASATRDRHPQEDEQEEAGDAERGRSRRRSCAAVPAQRHRQRRDAGADHADQQRDPMQRFAAGRGRR